jgi:hypothetical protein
MVGRVAQLARHAGAAAFASARAIRKIPRPIGMVLANSFLIVAMRALRHHSILSLRRRTIAFRRNVRTWSARRVPRQGPLRIPDRARAGEQDHGAAGGLIPRPASSISRPPQIFCTG